MLTETEVKIVLILADNEGHAEWELADILGMETSNLNPILKSLRSKHVIIKGPARQSKRERKLHKAGEYQETPYYLSDQLEDILLMIFELIRSDKVLDVGFSLRVIMRSPYMKSMNKQIGPSLARNLAYQVLHTYKPYTDSNFEVIRQRLNDTDSLLPFLEDDLNASLNEGSARCNIAPPSELRCWYEGYLRNRKSTSSM